MTKLKSLLRLTKQNAYNAFYFSWNIWDENQADNIGITSDFISNFIFSGLFYNFVYSSLATFFHDLINLLLRL